MKIFYKFFVQYGVREKKASAFAKSISGSDPDIDPDELKSIFDEVDDKDDFCEILADDYGISRKSDQNLIIAALKKCPEPLESSKYLHGFFGGKNLDHVEKEKDMICKMLARSKLLVTDDIMGPLDML